MTSEQNHHAHDSENRHVLNFCPHCGAELTSREAFGRTRRYCPRCERIIFRQHKIAAGLLLTDDAGRVLLVQRAWRPHRGDWTLPAGFVDYDEAPIDAAIRETREETGLEAEVSGIVDVVAGREHPHGADIVIVYRGRITGGELIAGDDATAARFFAPNALPTLAFQATSRALECWRAESEAGL